MAAIERETAQNPEPMKIGRSIKTLTAGCLALWIGAPCVFAQAGVESVGVAYSPHFFIAVIGGVILAIGFQILLTSLSVASGISLVGNVEKKAEKHWHEQEKERADQLKAEPGGQWEYDQATVRTREPEHRDESATQAVVHETEEEEKGGSPMVKLSRAVGIWTVITASLSLFFASLLAVRLTVVGTVWMGITLGLIIWAAFFALMTYLELRSVSTLIGGVFTAALSGLRSSFSAAKSVFGTSTDAKISRISHEAAAAIREELSQGFDMKAITRKLDEYVERLQPRPIDLDRVKAELIDLLKNVQLEQHSEMAEGHLDRETFFKLVDEEPTLKKEDAAKLKDMYGEISSALRSEGTGVEKAEAAIGKVASGGEAGVQHARAKLEEYLRRTGREELDPDRIREDINKIFEDPGASKEVLLNRLRAFDRSTLVSLLAQRGEMGEEKADKLISYVERAIQFVKDKTKGMKEHAGEMQHHAAETTGEKVSQLKRMPSRVEDRLRKYLSSLGRPEFDYDRIRTDFEHMLHDPKSSLKVLRARMKLYDRDSLVALLSSRKNISKEDAERMVLHFEQAKENVLRRAEKIEDQVRERIREARATMIHEAENVRKASASAAWWMVGTAVVSGVFSALGAALAIVW